MRSSSLAVPRSARRKRRPAPTAPQILAELPYYTLVYTAAAPAPVSQPPKEAGQGRPLQAYRCAPQRAGAYMPRTRAQTTIPFTKPETSKLARAVNSEIDPANLPQRIAADPMHGAVTALVALQGAWDTMVRGATSRRSK